MDQRNSRNIVNICFTDLYGVHFYGETTAYCLDPSEKPLCVDEVHVQSRETCFLLLKVLPHWAATGEAYSSQFRE